MKLQFPLTKKDNASYTADELLKLLADESTGHYLLGSHNFWHGGVHFTDAKTDTAHFKNVPVKAIADGTLVAYRININYELLDLTPPEEEEPKDDPNKFSYATSFCLIRHEYESPVAAQKMKDEQAAPTDNKDWVGRIVELTKNRNVRNPEAKANGAATFCFELLTGSRLKLTEMNSADNDYFKAKVAFVKGKPIAHKTSTTKSTIEVGDEVFFKINESDGTLVFKDASNTMQDWSDTQTLVTKADYRGYTFLLPALPEEYIHIPAGTELTLTHQATPSSAHNKVYVQVTAHSPLDIYTESTCTTRQHPANTNMYIAVTDEFGNMETAAITDSAGKTQQVPAVENTTRNKLTFYSLYMHLLPWGAYDFNQEQKEEETKIYLRRSGKLSLRNSASASGTSVVGSTNNGLFEVIDEADNPQTVDNLIFTHVYIVNESGTRTNPQDYWINTGKSGATTTYGSFVTETTLTATASSKQDIPLHWRHDNTIEAKALADVQVYIIEQQNNKPTLATLDLLQKDDIFTYHYANDLITYKKLVVGGEEKDTALIKITITKGLGKENMLNCQKQLYLLNEETTYKNIQEKVTPKKFDEVIPCNISVKSGETLGYLGLYESPKDVKPEAGKDSKHQLHFEILTNDTDRIDAFLDNKAKVTTGKKYLKVNKRTYVMFGADPDTLANAAPTTGLPLPYFNATAYLIKDWVLPLSETPIIKDKQGVEWYQLPVGKLSGAALTKDHYGWVRKGQATEELTQYDLRKLGFTVIEETDESSNGDMFVDADKVNENVKDFFQTILNEIDQLGNNDGKVTPNEIQAAYKREDLSDTLQKIIGYHPTEWQKYKINTVEVIANRIKSAVEADNKPEEVEKLNAIKDDLEEIVLQFSSEQTMHFLKEEQTRIDKLTFWDEVEELQANDKVWHFHPITLINYLGESELLCKECGRPFVELKFLKEIFPRAKAGFHEDFVSLSKILFEKYSINTCSQYLHLLAQSAKETTEWTAFRESLNYSRRTYTAERLYKMCYSAITAGFNRIGLGHYSRAEKIDYVDKHLLGNDSGYGKHCFGHNSYPDNDYRGRGLIHLTFYDAYKKCADATGLKIDSNPELLETDSQAIIESALWFWKSRNLGPIADNKSLTSNQAVDQITYLVNTAKLGLAERTAYKNSFTSKYLNLYGECASLQK